MALRGRSARVGERVSPTVWFLVFPDKVELGLFSQMWRNTNVSCGFGVSTGVFVINVVLMCVPHNFCGCGLRGAFTPVSFCIAVVLGFHRIFVCYLSKAYLQGMRQ